MMISLIKGLIFGQRGFDGLPEPQTHLRPRAVLASGIGIESFSTDWRRSRVRRLLKAGHTLIGRDYLKILSRPTKAKSKAA